MATIRVRQELVQLGSPYSGRHDAVFANEGAIEGPDGAPYSGITNPTYMSEETWKELGRPVFIDVEVHVADE